MTHKDDAPRPDQYQSLKLSGAYVLFVRDKSGSIINFRRGKNLVTSAAETLVAKLLDYQGAEDGPEYLEFGSGNQGALKSDTQLQTVIATQAREAASGSTALSNTLALIFSVTVSASYTVKEMGIFNAAAAGTMFSRFLTQDLTVKATDVIDLTWTLTILGVD